MKTKSLFCLLIICILSSPACGLFQPGFIATQTATPTLTVTQTLTPTPTETETPTSTPDPCLPENLPDAVKAIKDLQMQFDDLSGAAANAQREDVPDKVTELQDLLQTAEDQETPPCLMTLRDHQLKHMRLVIDTLNAFVDGTNKQTLDDMIKRARDEHDEFLREIDSLLGNS